MEISVVEDLEEGFEVDINIRKSLNSFLAKSLKLTAISEVGWTPPTDIYRTDEHLIVRMEIAGIEPSKLTISYGQNILIIEGERKDEDNFLKEHYYLMEIHFGYFRVVINIPCEVEESKAYAKYKEGFLYVIFPRKDKLIKTHIVKIK